MLPIKLLNFLEKILTPFGIWPNFEDHRALFLNMILNITFLIAVFAKTLNSLERESIENAFTLVNAGNLTLTYFLTLLVKKEKFKKMLIFVNENQNFLISNEEKILIKNAEKLFIMILKLFSIFLPATIVIRFLLPALELFYIQVRF